MLSTRRKDLVVDQICPIVYTWLTSTPGNTQNTTHALVAYKHNKKKNHCAMMI